MKITDLICSAEGSVLVYCAVVECTRNDFSLMARKRTVIYSNILSRIRDNVTNNCRFQIWWMDLLDVSITITLDDNSSHIELLDKESLTASLLVLGLVSSL
jgi:hypothetical protein